MPVGQFRRYPTASGLSKKGRILLILSIYYHNSVDNSYFVWSGTSPITLRQDPKNRNNNLFLPLPAWRIASKLNPLIQVYATSCSPHTGRKVLLCAEAVTPAHSSVICVRLTFKATQVIDDCLTPAIDVRPGAIADAVPRTCHVDYITAAMWRRYTVVRLLVGDHDDAVIRIAQAPESMAKLRSTVGLAGYDRIAQSKATTRRHPDQLVREAH